MIKEELIERSPLRVLEESIQGGLGSGNIGVLASRKGVGKTACLVHIATDKLFQNKPVIHVSYSSRVDYIINWYEDIFKEIAKKRELERAIEDAGIETPEGEIYYNVNPGSDWLNAKYREMLGPEIPPCPKAKRRYHAVNVGLDKRFSNNWMAGFHYTWSELWGNFAGLASTDEYGRQDPYFERYFDTWFIHRDQNMNETTGKLQTDKPHQFKLYGSYTFDWGLTFGFYSYAMSGTPVTRRCNIRGMYLFYSEGRFSDGRTPFLTKTDLYVEYNLKIGGEYPLQFNVNVSNLFNQRIVLAKFPNYNRYSFYLDDATLLAGFDYKEEVENAGVELDPWFMKDWGYTNGIDVRLGVKFIF